MAGLPGKGEGGAKVNFPDTAEDNSIKRKRYLTARYDKRTRRKLQEKISLEGFIFEELRKIYQTENDDFDCELDIDILLSMNDDERRSYIKERLINSPSSEEVQTAFINTIVDRLRNLALAKEVRSQPP
uniref:Protein phosphatase 1 regulatory subunit 14D n=1 Tax=Schistocephalus solidus TaxID=70667 RepID=A0A0X3PAK8_SCHSO